MELRLLPLALVVLSAPAEAAPPAAWSAVDSYLREQMRLNHIPSISMAVVREGRVEKLQSYGVANLEWDGAATTDTAYQLASTTKAVTGTALMLLVNEGRLSLHDSIARFLPDAPESWRAITIRQLATHSSGLSDDLGSPSPADAAEGVKRLADKALVFEPGSKSSYGIGGYVVLQHVIERVTGRPYARVLRERVLNPLAMAATRFDNDSSEGPFRSADTVRRRAGIYAWENGAQRISWFHFGSYAYTAGGLLASIEDLATWSAALDSGRLLPDAALASMWTPPTGADGTTLGFAVGWTAGRYRGRRTVGHSGGPALADLLRFPDEKLTVIVLANQQRMYPYLAQGVADLLLPASAEPAPTPLKDPDPDLAARMRALLATMARGDVPEEGFTPRARDGFVPNARAFLVPYARSLGEPTSLTLIEDNSTGATRKRIYRALYGAKAVRWTIELGDDRKIEGLGPSAE